MFDDAKRYKEIMTDLYKVNYIEDITLWCEDMDFIFKGWKQYFIVKYCFHHEKIKFISSSHHVILFLLYI